MLLLVAIKQQEVPVFKVNFSEQKLQRMTESLESQGLIAPKKTEGFKMTKEGNAFLRRMGVKGLDPELEAEYTELVSLYIDMGKKDYVGNKVRGLKYYCEYRAEFPDLDFLSLKNALQMYLRSTPPKFTAKLDLLVFKPGNVYSTKFNIDDCRLHGIYLQECR